MNAVADIDSKFFNFPVQFFCFASLNFRANFSFVFVCPSVLGSVLIDVFLSLSAPFYNFVLPTWHVLECQVSRTSPKLGPKARRVSK